MKAKRLALPDDLYSVDQLLAVAEELHQYSRSRAKNKPPLSDTALAALATLPAAERDKPDQVEELRQALEALSAAAPTITLTLAAAPPPNLRRELVRWLRQSIRSDILVNIHVNSDIAGGVVIRSTNHTYDHSFRSGLLAHADRFVKVLEGV